MGGRPYEAATSAALPIVCNKANERLNRLTGPVPPAQRALWGCSATKFVFWGAGGLREAGHMTGWRGWMQGRFFFVSSQTIDRWRRRMVLPTSTCLGKGSHPSGSVARRLSEVCSRVLAPLLRTIKLAAMHSQCHAADPCVCLATLPSYCAACRRLHRLHHFGKPAECVPLGEARQSAGGASSARFRRGRARRLARPAGCGRAV